MRKQNQALSKQIKHRGLRVVNAVGHGARIVDRDGRTVAQVHLEQDTDVKRALQLLRRRGVLDAL